MSLPSDLEDAVVPITGTDSMGFGTGFVVHRDAGASYIVTAGHVLKGIGTVKVHGIDAEIVTVRPSLGNSEIDLAVLRVEAEFPFSLRLRGNSM